MSFKSSMSWLSTSLSFLRTCTRHLYKNFWSQGKHKPSIFRLISWDSSRLTKHSVTFLAQTGMLLWELFWFLLDRHTPKLVNYALWSVLFIVVLPRTGYSYEKLGYPWLVRYKESTRAEYCSCRWYLYIHWESNKRLCLRCTGSMNKAKWFVASDCSASAWEHL